MVYVWHFLFLRYLTLLLLYWMGDTFSTLLLLNHLHRALTQLIQKRKTYFFTSPCWVWELLVLTHLLLYQTTLPNLVVPLVMLQHLLQQVVLQSLLIQSPRNLHVLLLLLHLCKSISILQANLLILHLQLLLAVLTLPFLHMLHWFILRFLNYPHDITLPFFYFKFLSIISCTFCDGAGGTVGVTGASTTTFAFLILVFVLDFDRPFFCFLPDFFCGTTLFTLEF